MNCTEADILMQRSLDGVLTKTERSELDSHLETCAACTPAFAEYRSLTRLVRDWSVSEKESLVSSQDFLASVMNAVQRTPVPRPSAAALYLGVGAFVAVVVAAIGYFTPWLQPDALLAPIHPMGIVDSATSTLASVPHDQAQSLQTWISETQTQLPLGITAWTAVAINGMLILGRVLTGRRKVLAGGSHG